MWSRTRLTMQLSGWMQTIRSHWRMSLLPKKCDGWNTTREHTGPHYVSPVHQRPTLSRPTLNWHLCRWHHSQFLIWRDRWTSALQQDLDDLSQRLAANKMVTNAAKKKCLLVTRRCLTNKIVDSSLDPHLRNSNIEQVDSQKHWVKCQILVSFE